MNGKRYLSLSLAALMLFGTGCSKEAVSAEATSAEETVSVEEQTTTVETSVAQQAETGIAPSDPETVHLTFAVSTDDMPGNYYTDIVTAFQEQNETIQIELWTMAVTTPSSSWSWPPEKVLICCFPVKMLDY
jgi:PBP1b-binding outer membrane lipoprotein LpoB